ncbi:siderophore ferric iron reductase [Vibrio proteolyticus]|uniref:Ferric siderophore reductase C-terminal domain-containing protein n=1 Tax=Vibrio proteolyticus NBRC 13287 TaxID=1219065 RepID=U2ZCF8_VIBPR|nr:siderophore ferric iron reductase [Vibrio proteolyticus]GAD65381.1 hypothetical protein VPR01S_01_01540 [Vibrio proteolyticus NBRC 13287]
MQHGFFDELFHHAKQITPYLSGEIGPVPELSIHISTPASETIQALYHRLAQSNPDAGSAYWLTRTWDLLCWQPVYIAFLSIYGFRTLPDIHRMAQLVQPEFIAGYRFADANHIHGDEETLIAEAGRQLTELLAFYRDQISQWSRIRPGFTNHLLADLLLGCIIKVQQFFPELTNDYLTEQAALWLNACQLPDKHLKSLSVHPQSGRLQLVRTSCCLVFKCQGRELCADCPRHPDNRK